MQSNHFNFEKCLCKLHSLVKGNATSFSNCIHDLKASVLDPEGKGGARAVVHGLKGKRLATTKPKNKYNLASKWWFSECFIRDTHPMF